MTTQEAINEIIQPLGGQAQVGWVIERGDSDPAEPKYWCAGHWNADRKIAWTSNHMAAIRFARREDAENTHHRLFPCIAVRICEHQWA